MTVSLFAPPPRGLDVPEYRCVLLDPPWAERGGGKIKRGADRHYGLATQQEIVEAVLGAPWRAAEHAHCWMWVTDNFLPDGLDLMRKMGFEYTRTWQWVKIRAERPAQLDVESGYGAEGVHHDFDVNGDTSTPALKIGIGQYARGCHEMMLFGTRGSGQHESVWRGHRDVRSVLFAPHERGEDGKVIHSRKPRASYDLIERVSKGPRIELFARIARERWDAWGNQAPTEDA